MATKTTKVGRYDIIGAGPAGLTAAYLLSKRGKRVVVWERDKQVGGISKTVRYKSYRFDVGGHRFFAKMEKITRLWDEVLGKQFLTVRRSSRIFYKGKFFNYPLEPRDALANLGLLEAAAALASYLKSRIRPIGKEKSLADIYRNGFGNFLYLKFFRDYSRRLWGIDPEQMSPDWGRQRVGKLSLLGAVKDAFFPSTGKIKSLVKSFRYPKYGPGQMWETMAKRIEKSGGEIKLNSPVGKVVHRKGWITAVEIGGKRRSVDMLISTMALRDLILSLSPVPPKKVVAAAEGLKYRDFILAALVVKRKKVFPDQWIYIQDPGFTTLRVQNAGNWSPYLVGGGNKSVLGMEFTALEGDRLWRRSDSELFRLAADEAERLGFVRRGEVVDGRVVRQLKAYPVYDLGYQRRLETVRQYLDGFKNLVTIGRNGMHKYNNMDHSMLTAIQAVENLFGANHDIWQVNVNADYHEEKKG